MASLIHTIFTDGTAEAGVEGDRTNGAAAVGDYNNDRFIDMYARWAGAALPIAMEILRPDPTDTEIC